MSQTHPASELESVGRPAGNVAIGLDDQGRIRIKGPHVARWRVDADGLHALCDEQGWLQTNDLGRMQDGTLYFDGRADDLINCGGVKIVPDILEERIRAKLDPGVRIAVARVRDEARGEVVLAVIEGDATGVERLKEAATAAMKEMGVAAAGSLHVRNVAAIPATATGKPRRRELTDQFESTREDASLHTGQFQMHDEAKGASQGVRAVFERVFPGATVKSSDTFESLGGDSLRYIQFSMQYERQFGVLPQQWESLTVAQLQKRVKSATRSGWRSLEPGTLMRATAMTFIVARHAVAFIYSRNFGAGILLFALGGYALARFQLPEIIRKGNSKSALVTALLVAIPTILIAAPTQFMTHTFEPLQFLLVSNFLDPKDPRWVHGIPFYFAEIYVQLFLLAAILFSFSRVRTMFREYPLPSALALFACAVALRYIIGALWNTDYLFNRVPQSYAWIFTLGLVVGVAKTVPERLLVSLLVAVTCYIYWGFETSSYLVAGGLTLVLFVPSLKVPAPVKTVVGGIAAASMFIYLAHGQVISIVNHVFGEQEPWISLVSAIVVGVVLAYLFSFAQRLVVQTSIGRRIFGMTSG